MFQDREQAGRHLAAALQRYVTDDSVVVALPRGGVPVGFEVAKAFNIPLYVLVARKIGAPDQEELGIGAIAENGVLILDRPAIFDLKVSPIELEAIIEKEQKELARRVEVYRHGESLPDLSQKNILLVDDGLATGITARAALSSLQKIGAKKISIAAPVCADSTVNQLMNSVDTVVCLLRPHNLYAVGRYYQNFLSTTDEQVVELLYKARKFGKKQDTRSYH